MNILIQLAHPAQFHLFKNTAKELMEHGHNVHFLIKSKDILEQLLKDSGLPYCNILPQSHRKTTIGMVQDMLIRDWRILKYALRHKIDIFLGSPVELAHVGWLLHKHRINFGEDDASIVMPYIRLGGFFMQTYLTPVSCNIGPLEPKAIHYQGFHKLAYLHPKRFTPDRSVVEKYFTLEKPYFLLRFAELKAYHDVSAKAQGITTDIAQKLIDILLPYGDVYITSERELEPQFEKYRLKINPLDIHHVLAFASLYIGDSQSMAVEAAMLGTPSIRFNDFAGKIGVLEELEHNYELTKGVLSSDPKKLYSTIKEWLALPNIKEAFLQRRQRMLCDKIDVTAFFTWFIENYPMSKKIMLDNPDYQKRFSDK